MKHYLIKLPLILLLICGVSIVEGKRKKATLTERINSASKIYFVPLIVKPYSMSLQVEEPKEPANPNKTPSTSSGMTKIKTDLKSELLTNEDIEALNKTLFDKMKELIGDKLVIVPDKYFTKRKSLGTEIQTFDVKKMDCDIYVRAELEMEAAFREAKYKIIGDYVNKEKYMVNPMAPKIHIKIFHKEKPGKKGKKIFSKQHILIGYKSVEVGGSVDISKTLEEAVSGKEVTKTAYTKIESDEFPWKAEYGKNEALLKNVFNVFAEIMREKLKIRLVESIGIFEKELKKKLAK